MVLCRNTEKIKQKPKKNEQKANGKAIERKQKCWRFDTEKKNNSKHKRNTYYTWVLNKTANKSRHYISLIKTIMKHTI